MIDGENNELYIGDLVALYYVGHSIKGRITAFTKQRVRITCESVKYYNGYRFLKNPNKLLKIKG